MTFRPSGTSLVIATWLIALSASRAPGQVRERGTIVDRVHCAANPEQTYALYLPSTYSPERLGSDDGREVALMMLRDRLSKLSRKATVETDRPERSQARRVLRSVTAGAPGRVQDREYLTLLEQYRLPGR